MVETEAISLDVPQGYVLGPIVSSLYMLPFGDISSKFKGVSFHFYADDIYLSFKPDENDKVTVLNYLTAIMDWMTDNLLQLNADEVLIVASNSIAPMVAQRIGSLLSTVQSYPGILVLCLTNLCTLIIISNL